MRFVIPILLISLFSGCAISDHGTSPETVAIRSIIPRYIQSEQFVTIREYLTGVEHSGNRLIMRTDTNERSGFYFVLQLDAKAHHLPQGTRITGEFYTGNSSEIQTYTLEMPAERPRTKYLLFGLTGEAWPYGQNHPAPAAWRFTIIGPDSKQLAEKHSYLWEK